MIVKSKDIIYSDLDTFFYNCSFKDDDGDYTYSCSHKDNGTDGQCLDSGCPFLWKLDKDISNRYELNELFRIEQHLYIEWDYEDKYNISQYPYVNQYEAWGEDTVMCCGSDDFHIFDLLITVGIDMLTRKYITYMGVFK